MFLYNLTLQPSTAINVAVVGHFSGTKQQEIVISRITRLELIRADPNSGKLQTLLAYDIFGMIRSLTPFRLTGGSKGAYDDIYISIYKKKREKKVLINYCFYCSIDYIIVGSDSGRVVILEYNPSKNRFDKVHQETFGKSGCRRIVPGQYLAVDPKGRSVMIGILIYVYISIFIFLECYIIN